MFGKPGQIPSKRDALPGRDERMPVPDRHFVNGHRLEPPYPDGLARAVFGMGCFWGAEKKFWQLSGVYSTAVGYAAGLTPNPTYREVCTGMTGHAEVVLVVFDPKVIRYEDLLKVFWENHDPTQGMRQGNDVGTQYRSGIYYDDDEQRRAAEASRTAYETTRCISSSWPIRSSQSSSAGAGVSWPCLSVSDVSACSAVPRQEPRRILRPRRHRRQLSGRYWRSSLVSQSIRSSPRSSTTFDVRAPSSSPRSRALERPLVCRRRSQTMGRLCCCIPGVWRHVRLRTA